MTVKYKSEREVEVNLLRPLFQDVLGYSEDDLDWNRSVRITFGRETKTKSADLVVSHRGHDVITVEAKKPTQSIQSGIGQVDSYAFALQTPYSVVCNGRHFLLRGYYSFNSRLNVIDDDVTSLQRSRWSKVAKLIGSQNIDASMHEPANVIAAPDEVKIQDFRRFFRKIHNTIRDRDKLDPAAAFDELSKLLFLKAAEDEWRDQKRSKPVLTPEKIAEWEALGNANELINKWFQSAVADAFPGVFDEHPRIKLTTGTLKELLSMMAPFHVRNGDVDIKGRAFEEFLPSQLRGAGLGQFFTPRQVVNFMAELAGISIRDVVVDFSCGSGGFLIKAFEMMQARVEQLPAGIARRLGVSKEQMLDDIKSHQLYGIDAEPRAARTAKMNMLMWGDGRRVVRGNGLANADNLGRPYEPEEYQKGKLESGCTLILANPPFGSKEKDREVLKEYELGAKYQERDSQKTEILFVEKGLKLLQPEGRMLIVLPLGLLSAVAYQKVRDFILSQAEIRAIICLPTHTFVQSGVPTVNTCVLYVQKFTDEKRKLYTSKTIGMDAADIRALLRSDPDFDHDIFMGTAEFIGYEPSGRSIVRKGENTDLDALLEDFEKQAVISHPDVDVFDFASTHYGDKGHRRKEQVVRGTVRGLKTSFVVKLSETEDRLDPPYYLFRYQAADVLKSLEPLGDSISEAGESFVPRSDEELDAEYASLSVSSDGKVSLDNYARGEELILASSRTSRRFQRVRHNDIVYNPMRINIGSIGVVPEALDGGLVSPDYIVFRTTGNPEFLVNLLRSPFYRMYIDVITTGSIRDRLYLRDLKAIRVPRVAEHTKATICERIHHAAAMATGAMKSVIEDKQEIVRQLHDLVRAANFKYLASEWKKATRLKGNVAKRCKHPAYQAIINMGEAAVPLILQDLSDNGPDDWFSALTTITGENPITEDISGKMTAMTEVWLRWGVTKGYMIDYHLKTKPASRT